MPGFQEGDFVDPTDPHKLALVDNGIRDGHLCIEMDPDELAAVGEYQMQGREVLQQTVETAGLPFEVIPRRVERTLEYGGEEQTVYYFVIAHSQEHLDQFASQLRDNPRDGRLIAEFEGYPECCIDAHDNERDYLGELESYLDQQNMGENEEELLAALPELSHIPCKPTCEDSLALARNYMDFFQEEYPEAASYYEEFAEERLEEIDALYRGK